MCCDAECVENNTISYDIASVCAETRTEQH